MAPKCTCAECSKHVASHHKVQAPHKHDSGVQLYTEVLCKTVTGTSHTKKCTNKQKSSKNWNEVFAGQSFFAANKSQTIWIYLGMLLDDLWNDLCRFVAMIWLCLFCLRSMSGIRVWFVYLMIFAGYCFFAYLRSCVCVCVCAFVVGVALFCAPRL